MTNIQVPRRQITGIDTEPCGSENWVLLQQFLDSPIIFKRKVSYRLVFRSVVTVADWVRSSVRTYARIISQLNTLRAPEYLLRVNIILCFAPSSSSTRPIRGLWQIRGWSSNLYLFFALHFASSSGDMVISKSDSRNGRAVPLFCPQMLKAGLCILNWVLFFLRKKGKQNPRICPKSSSLSRILQW